MIDSSVPSALDDAFELSSLKEEVVHSERPRQIRDHQILLLTQARGQLTIDGQVFELRDRCIILISKHQVHRFGHGVLTGFRLRFGDCFWEWAPQSSNNCKAVLFDTPAAPRHISPGDAAFRESPGLRRKNFCDCILASPWSE